MPTDRDIPTTLQRLREAAVMTTSGRVVGEQRLVSILGVSAEGLRRWRPKRGDVKRVSVAVRPSSRVPRGRIVAWKLADAERAAASIEARKVKRWSSRDVDFLTDHFGKMSRARLAEALGVSKAAIDRKAWRLGLTLGSATGRLTTLGLAALLGVTHNTVRRWCQQGMPCVRAADRRRSRLIEIDAADRWLGKQPRIASRLDPARLQQIQRRAHGIRKGAA